MPWVGRGDSEGCKEANTDWEFDGGENFIWASILHRIEGGNTVDQVPNKCPIEVRKLELTCLYTSQNTCKKNFRIFVHKEGWIKIIKVKPVTIFLYLNWLASGSSTEKYLTYSFPIFLAILSKRYKQGSFWSTGAYIQTIIIDQYQSKIQNQKRTQFIEPNRE